MATVKVTHLRWATWHALAIGMVPNTVVLACWSLKSNTDHCYELQKREPFKLGSLLTFIMRSSKEMHRESNELIIIPKIEKCV